MGDIQDLKTAEEFILKNINRLQAQEMNLVESIKQKTIQLDGMARVDDNKKLVDIQVKYDRVIQREASLEAEKRKQELKTEEINHRLSSIESRELQAKELDSKTNKFYEERRNFENYRNKVIKELKEAEGKAAGFKDIEDNLLKREQDIIAKRKSLDLRDKEYMDRIGELNEKEKSVKMEIEHLEALKKETVNV